MCGRWRWGGGGRRECICYVVLYCLMIIHEGPDHGLHARNVHTSSATHVIPGRSIATSLPICATVCVQEYIDMSTADIAPQSLAQEVAAERPQLDDTERVPPHTTDKEGVHNLPQHMLGKPQR